MTLRCGPIRFGGWWQRRNAPAGFTHPHVLDFLTVISTYGWKPRPLEFWPNGWFVLWIGKWRISVSFRRHRFGRPTFNPADYDSVP
jgi:hypothetical protein